MKFLKRNNKKISPRRKQLRDNFADERVDWLIKLVNEGILGASLIAVLFVVLATMILSFSTVRSSEFGWLSFTKIFATFLIVVIVTAGASLYIYSRQIRIVQNTVRGFSMLLLFTGLLLFAKICTLDPDWSYFTVATAVTSAVILTIAYNQRFAMGMSLFYSILASLAVDRAENLNLLLTMLAGVVPCCYCLHEIRTRMKLVQVSLISATTVFVIALSLGILQDQNLSTLFKQSGTAALATLIVGVVIQSILPVIERVFGVVTSMTLLDYSDANQPLLKKLAMEAPGTYSHSLLVGAISESAAEAIGANGLLARVGAYYHDIGKINKPAYFVENQMGETSRHDHLSPAMSQLVIVGHVKDGIEIAKEFGLPVALRQFIETHHGTTLIQYFFEEAKKKHNGKGSDVSESEFRYVGPKPQSIEAAIVMIADSVESATRAMVDVSPTRIESLVHNIIMKRLQDGQFDECDITLRELSSIQKSLTKALAAHHHARIAYPESNEQNEDTGFTVEESVSSGEPENE